MAVFSVPLGVRFYPTKLQLVDYFLRVKHSGQELPECYPQFLDFDVYSNHPFNILNTTKERRGVNDVNEGFFFCQLNKLTPNGKRISRCIKGIGTWSEKSKTTDVCNGNNRVVGIEKYLI
ncbi:NAC domain-containing protein 91-like [Silene latifolia]|uniref:NAC domain-containing protein 91-like n=1 Tax=Silene latifolia TaxID=37657 RepID=UPI003D76EEAD